MLFIIALFTVLLSIPFATPVSASTNDFSFSSATFDYYLSPDDETGSRLHVKETLVAEFPDYDQNHGIERVIPYTNQNGKNLTVLDQSALNFSVLRNGTPEPYQVTKDDGYYTVRIGNANSYVHSTQTYTLEYDFTRAITNYDNFQELYWDANGTGWSQPFQQLTANVHLEEGITTINYPGTTSPTSCYVGSYGSKNQSRCSTTSTSDGFSFSANNLLAHENLTFDLTFPADTFIIPPDPDSYVFIIVIASELLIILGISLIIYFKVWRKARDNYLWYKHHSIPPQYTPLSGYTVAQLAAVYLGKTKDPKTATLLELAVSKKITLIKGEKKKLSNKYHWSLQVNSLDLTDEQLALLELITGYRPPIVGETYLIEKQAYSSELLASFNRYSSAPQSSLVQRGDLTKAVSKSSSSKRNTLALTIAILSFVPLILTPVFALIDAFTSPLNYYHIVAEWLILPIIILPVAALIIHISLVKRFRPYIHYTQQGLEHSNYLEGLKLYIKMAEADRLKFLQSVNGADTSNEGVVKLYEKLLPYAALFGLEQSWLQEMEHYYGQMSDVTRPDWYDVELAYALSSHSFDSSFSRPVDPSSYSSSDSSGGGGGGFSGGGGGGGGGGGW